VAHPLRIGIKLSQQVHPIEAQREAWRMADEAGFDHIWPFDHLIALGNDPTRLIFDGWTILGALAENTKRARIGLNVTGNLYRHPGLLAKIAVTVDHLSGGRLEFAIGTGWAEFEHTMLGLEYGTAGQRIARLDEACQVFKSLWSGERRSFEGEHYRLVDAIERPMPVQQPHPPIWIGGRGERKTLRVVAMHADVWNISGNHVRDASFNLDEDIRLAGVLDGHCEAIGRDPAEIRRSVQLLHRDDLESTLQAGEAYVNAGFPELIVSLAGGQPEAQAERAATELLPRLRALG
jgi:F420-dependent oxidoreductase-like protein